MYNNTMISSKLSASARFRAAIHVLQQTTRTTGDIAYWLEHNADLLRAVSYELGHRVNEDAYQATPAVYKVEFHDDFIFESKHPNIKAPDKYMRDYCIGIYPEYHTDNTINLQLIFSTFPEAGIHFDSQRGHEIVGTKNKGRAFLSPAQWPIAASHMFSLVYDPDLFYTETLDELLSDIYTGTNKETLKAMLDASLFSNASVLCDWLIANQIPRQSEEFSITTVPQNLV